MCRRAQIVQPRRPAVQDRRPRDPGGTRQGRGACWCAIRRRWRGPRRTRRAPAICWRARLRPSSRSTRPRPTPRSPRQMSQADQAAIDIDRIRLGYTQVEAPIDGRVGAVRVTQGNIVRSSDGGEGLVTITQMKPLRVTFTLPERDLPALRAAAAGSGKVAVRVNAHDGSGGRALGELSFIDSSVDSTSGTITAKALLPNDDGALWPGQYVDIEVELGGRRMRSTDPAGRRPAGPGWPVRLCGRPGPQGRARESTPSATRCGDAVVTSRPPARRPRGRRGPAAPARRQRAVAETASARQPAKPRKPAEAAREHVGAVHPPARRHHPPLGRADARRAVRLSSCRWRPCRRSISRRSRSRAQLPGASPETMANAVATPLIKQFSTDPGDPADQHDQCPGIDLDRHRVRPRPRHRPGGGRRPGGDRPDAAAAAGRDDHSAQLPQAQPGRRADPAAGAAPATPRPCRRSTPSRSR